MSALAFHDVALTPKADENRGMASFEVVEGSAHLILAPPSLGPAVLRFASGLETPSRGRITVLGEDPATLSRSGVQRLRQRLGVNFERCPLVRNLTLRQNLIVPLIYNRTTARRAAERRAEELIENFHIEKWAHLRPSLAPARIQKVAALARAMASGPELAILENPTAGLPESVAERTLEGCLMDCGTLVIVAFQVDEPITRVIDTSTALSDRGQEFYFR